MPDIAAQYADATNDLALFDLSDRAQIELRGADRLSFLHNFCTNDVKKLQPGEGCEAFLTSIKGRILGHIIVSVTEESLWIDSVPGSAEFIVGHLDRYLITEDVTITDRSREWSPLCLVGPTSPDWFAEKGCDVADLPLWGQRTATLWGTDVMIRRVGFTEPPAFEIVVPDAQLTHMWQSLRDTGETGVTVGMDEVFDALRIEAGFSQYGIDLTDENIAQEAGRNDQAISFTKGCYLGQEPIARLDALGHTNKELRRLHLPGGPVPEHGAIVKTPDGQEIGRITSAALSPRDGRPVALAMLKTAALASTPLEQLTVQPPEAQATQ